MSFRFNALSYKDFLNPFYAKAPILDNTYQIFILLFTTKEKPPTPMTEAKNIIGKWISQKSFSNLITSFSSIANKPFLKFL